jgi:hypothetical protein
MGLVKQYIPILTPALSLKERVISHQSFDVPSSPDGLNKSTSRNRTNTMTSFQPEPR